MLQIGSIDAGHCIDAPNTSARKTRVTPIARHTYRKTGVTPIARQVSLTLFTGRNVGKPLNAAQNLRDHPSLNDGMSEVWSIST